MTSVNETLRKEVTYFELHIGLLPPTYESKLISFKTRKTPFIPFIPLKFCSGIKKCGCKRLNLH